MPKVQKDASTDSTSSPQARSAQDWKKILSPEQYRILRESGTETPFTGKYLDMKERGVYSCAGCRAELFSSDTKYESGSGWPSFYDVANSEAVELTEDSSYGMNRVGVVCKSCGGHLGHLFDDGPSDKTGKRYCISSCALEFSHDAAK